MSASDSDKVPDFSNKTVCRNLSLEHSQVGKYIIFRTNDVMWRKCIPDITWALAHNIPGLRTLTGPPPPPRYPLAVVMQSHNYPF
jgi:hypothetical protein